MATVKINQERGIGKSVRSELSVRPVNDGERTIELSVSQYAITGGKPGRATTLYIYMTAAEWEALRC